MTTIDPEEVKRVVSGMKDRGRSRAQANYLERLHAWTHRRKMVDRLKPSLVRAGFDSNKLEAAVGEERTRWRHSLGERSPQALQTLSSIEKPFRSQVESRIKTLELASKIQPSAPTF